MPKQDNCLLAVYDDIAASLDQRDDYSAAKRNIPDSFSYDVTVHRPLEHKATAESAEDAQEPLPQLLALGILPHIHFTFCTLTMHTPMNLADEVQGLTAAKMAARRRSFATITVF